jgi:hypothetical protein
VVFSESSRKGASAVPEPVSATAGSARWNSAKPPVVKVAGLVWLAFTSTGVPLPSAVMVCGSTPGRARQAVTAIADDARHAAPVVRRRDEADVRPVLLERQILRDAVGLGCRCEQTGDGKRKSESGR